MTKDEKDAIKAFRTCCHIVISTFPTREDEGSTDVCSRLAAIAMEFSSYFTARAAVAHILDHDGTECAIGIVSGIGELAAHDAKLSFRALCLTHGIEDPFAVEEDINKQTYKAGMDMLRKAEEKGK